MEIIPSNLKFDFMGKSKLAFLLSLIVIALSVYVWVIRGDSRYGIDYLGGNEFVIKLEETVGSGSIRRALQDGGLKNFVVQAFETGSKEFSIRLGADDEAGAVSVKERVKAALDAKFSEKYKIIAATTIGPTIGKELQRQALIAIVVGLIGILGYITYRFELAFALGAVAALFHDVIVSIGVYLALGHDLNMASLAACLTVVGYSVNDTIIVFDRMREEMFKRKEFVLADLMNFSINVTLSRTIITSLTSLFAAAALLFFGGGAIADLSLLLFVGVITGTYSTIFIASPVALAWENFRNPLEAEEA